MSVSIDRASWCTPGKSQAQHHFTELELLEKARAAILLRRGLIHGSMINGKRVCALGAVAVKFGDFSVPTEAADRLQEFNDSMPKVRTATRRKRVLAWIEKRLKELKQ